MDVDGGEHLAVAVHDRGGDRGDALGELVTDPCVASPTDHDQPPLEVRIAWGWMPVWGVNASRCVGQQRTTPSRQRLRGTRGPGDRVHRSAVVPVQSRTWTSMPASETWAMYRTRRAFRDRQASRLPDLRREALDPDSDGPGHEQAGPSRRSVPRANPIAGPSRTVNRGSPA